MSHFCSPEPSGLLLEHKSSVVGGDFSANVGKRIGGGDIVHKELCGGSIQMGGSGAGDEVKELRDPAVKRGRLQCVHGCNEEVVCSIALDALYAGVLESSVDAVPYGNISGR